MSKACVKIASVQFKGRLRGSKGIQILDEVFL